ncbi:MAG: hypothetical protein LBN98_03910 [Prevotellaceae bacterium]|jgi:hypothetical protein|nr:hypothetical protein [Prevotellaceae bacterium]
MKKYVLTLIFLAAGCSAVLAQKKITMNVRTGQNVNEALSNSRFLFPEFQEVMLATKKGSGQARMNYNMLTGVMLFIGENGDTLALTNPDDIFSIRFGQSDFIHTSKGYVEVLATAGHIRLVVSRRIKPATVKQYGAYGMTTSTAAIENAAVISDKATPDGLTINREITYAVVQTFYLQSGKSLGPVTEKNFQKNFGKNKDIISSYVKEHDLDLKQAAGLIRLFNFCAGEED